MLTDLTDADVLLLYQGSDPEIREGWNVLQNNRFMTLANLMEAQKMTGKEVFDYVQKRAADLLVTDMITEATNG